MSNHDAILVRNATLAIPWDSLHYESNDEPVQMSETPFPCHATAVTYRSLMHALFQGRASRILGYAGSEAVLESAGDVLEVPHAAGADSLSALGFLAPVVCMG